MSYTNAKQCIILVFGQYLEWAVINELIYHMIICNTLPDMFGNMGQPWLYFFWLCCNNGSNVFVLRLPFSGFGLVNNWFGPGLRRGPQLQSKKTETDIETFNVLMKVTRLGVLGSDSQY